MLVAPLPYSLRTSGNPLTRSKRGRDLSLLEYPFESPASHLPFAPRVPPASRVIPVPDRPDARRPAPPEMTVPL
jgi:hypothetical protein